jgi:hypothetical protein
MKRAVGLLLLLFGVWLLALPGARLTHAPVSAAVPAVSAYDGKVGSTVEHVVQQLAQAPVLRAALWARLPAAPLALPQASARWARGVVERAPDLRAELRRVQTRRRVPRLSSEPPWC